MMLRSFVHDINAKGFIEFLGSSDTTQTVHIFIGMDPVGDGNFRIHVDNPQQTLHCFLSRSRVFRSVLPEMRHLVSYFGIGTGRVVMKTHTPFGSIEIVAHRKTPNANTHFFPLKNHGLVQIVRNVHDKMTPAEGIPRRPVGLHLRTPVNARDAFGLTQMPQVLALRAAFVIRIAHNGTGVTEGGALRRNTALDIGQIGRQNGHVIVCGFHLTDNVRVPMLCV
mmetsp:Transcript_4541/g.7078  ORF Transcript_4541/g.7078 Transcript_4541/m.7078 type:complete len:223 (-) Transcript_4541:760-1428(-)